MRTKLVDTWNTGVWNNTPKLNRKTKKQARGSTMGYRSYRQFTGPTRLTWRSVTHRNSFSHSLTLTHIQCLKYTAVSCIKEITMKRRTSSDTTNLLSLKLSYVLNSYLPFCWCLCPRSCCTSSVTSNLILKKINTRRIPSHIFPHKPHIITHSGVRFARLKNVYIANSLAKSYVVYTH